MLLRSARQSRHKHGRMADVKDSILHRHLGREHLTRRLRREVKVRHHDDEPQKDTRQEGKAFHRSIRHGIYREAAIDRWCHIVRVPLNVRRKLQQRMTVKRTANERICCCQSCDNRCRTAAKPS